MFKLFRKTKSTRTMPNPNVQDTLNSLRIPPLSQALHQAEQCIHGDPAIAQDQMQVNVLRAGPSSSSVDLMNPTTSILQNQMQVQTVSEAEPSSAILVDSMAISSPTTQDHIQEDIGMVLPQRQRRGRISSTISIGQDEAFKNVCDFLKENDVGMVGIYGMGGVGKTTLMKKIRNEFLEPSNFEVTWVVVSRIIDKQQIRSDVLKGMSLPFSLYQQLHINGFEQTPKVLHEKKVALLFDDIWEFLDFEEFGISDIILDTSLFKVIFTTRSERVCRQMQPDRVIKVECLKWNDSWALFEKNVGKKTLESDYRISDVAKEVVKECKGLPLALIVIGRAMTCKNTLEEWKHALTSLQKSPSEVSDVEAKLFARLKLSYDALPDHGEKECFLYCCIYPRDLEMNSDWLVKYWIGEGLLTLNGSFEEALNRGHDIIGTLLATCLLEKVSSNRWVKMHDVLRDMGLYILSTLNRNCFVHGSLQLAKAQITDRWRAAHRIYVLNEDELPEQPLCLNLSTLIFFATNPDRLIVYASNPSIKIANGFFKSMCTLRVLELTHVEFLDVPVAIGQLIELRYLGIRRTNLKTLPREIGNLRKLEMLYLLQNMTLKELPTTIGQLVELRKLSVSPCPKVLPVELGSLSKLEILDLWSIFAMEAIPTSTFQNMAELRTLHLSVTSLKILPVDMWDLMKLEDLRIDVRRGDVDGQEELPDPKKDREDLNGIPPTEDQDQVDFMDRLKGLFKSQLWDLTKLEDLRIDVQLGDLDGQVELLDPKEDGEDLSKPQPPLVADQVDFMDCLKRLFKTLTRLCMRYWPITSEDELLSALQYMDKLSELEIEGFSLKQFVLLTNSCLSRLKELHILVCPNLEKVHIGHATLQNLRKLEISNCRSLKCIVGLEYLHGLVKLTIIGGEIEELIKANDEVKEGCLCFANLKFFQVGHLPRLKSICTDAVLFPSLTRFNLVDLANLEKLPRGLMNENRTLEDGEIRGRKEWWDRLLWQDDDFKTFLLPRFVDSIQIEN